MCNNFIILQNTCNNHIHYETDFYKRNFEIKLTHLLWILNSFFLNKLSKGQYLLCIVQIGKTTMIIFVIIIIYFTKL